MLKIYHNPRCAKSRDGLKYLEKQGCDFEVVHYLDDPITQEDFARILMKLNLKPSELVRTQEELFRRELKGKYFTDEEWIKIILDNPKLLVRPIVEGRYKAVVAIPAERIDGVMG